MVAVLVAHADLEVMSGFIEYRGDLSFSEDTYLVNSFNFFVTDPRFGEGYAQKESARTQGIEACLAGESSVGLYNDYRDSPVIGAFRLIRDHRLCILTEVDQAEAYAPILALRNHILGIGAILVLLASLLGIFFARGISNPIYKLSQGAEEIGAGNLAYRIGLNRQDEIGGLATAFNQMAANLRKSLGETVQRQRTILALSQAAQSVQLARTTGTVFRTVGEEVKKLGYHAVIFNLVEDVAELRIAYLSIESKLLKMGERLAGISAGQYRQKIKTGDLYDQVIQGKEAIYVPNMVDRLVDSLPRLARPAAHQIVDTIGFRNAVYAPMVIHQKIFGILVIAGNNLTVDDVSTVTAFANQAAIALENAQLLEELQDFNQELEKRVQERTQDLKEAETATLNIMADLEDAWQKAEAANRSLNQEKAFTDQIINSIPGVFYVFDASGKFLRWNDNFSTVTEYSDEEIVQMHPTQLFQGADREHIGARIQQVFEEGTSDAEANFTTKTGRQVPYYFTGFRTLIDEQPILIGTGIDISDLKQAQLELAQKAEELERSNKELEQFAYVASHDLQEPLRMVASYLQLLERRYAEKLDADAFEFIQFAVDGATRMKTLINDLLAYSRVGTRGNPFKPTDLNRVLGQVRANLGAAIDESQTLLTSDGLPTLMADEIQMVQLFQNLVSNAIKFRNESAPRVHVGAGESADGWVFSVHDNGIGIDPEYFERIFVIFQRLHARGKYPGTGIGLAISKRIVERHGGRIWVESQPGEGATFYFTMSAGALR
jgi:PAS domain S-box-containing protein